MPQSIPTRSGDTFQKQEVWLDCTRYNPTTGEAIPNTVAFEFGGKYMELLQNFAEGDSVTITFDIQGYKYEKAGVEKIFTKLQPINIEAATEKKPEPKGN